MGSAGHLIQDGIFTMRWRDGGTEWSPPMQTGQVYTIKISLWNTSYVFDKGHRLRVAVSSSNYPRFNNNPNDYSSAAANHSGIVANNTVWAGGVHQSHLDLPVVSLSQLPQTWSKETTEAYSDLPERITRPVLNRIRR